MAAKKKPQDFETRLARLQELVEHLEREDAPLEKGMELYKEGQELVRACREQLNKARYEVSVYSGKGGEEEFVPLAEEEGAPGGLEEE